MKAKTITAFRLTSHFILVFLSMGLSINLFIRFSVEPAIQALFGLMGFSTELIKVYILVLAKSDFMSLSKKRISAGVAKFSVYLALAAISAVASLGFTLLNLEQQAFESQEYSNTQEIESLEEEIDRINQQIDTNMGRYEDLPSDWITASEQYIDRIEDLRETKDQKQQEIREFREEAREESSSATEDMFVLLGEMISMEGRSVMFNMMLFLVVMLEVCIALTAGSIEQNYKDGTEGKKPSSENMIETPGKKTSSDIKKEPPQPFSIQSPDRIMQYIDALFSGEDSRLLSDKKVSEVTELSLEECAQYRKFLHNTQWKGRSVIVSVPGATRPVFSKNDIKKIVKFKIDAGITTIS